jgi:hypothetical protein
MNNLAQARTKVETAVSGTSWLLPAMLAGNTLALFALEQVGGIPNWIKTATALFLAF